MQVSASLVLFNNPCVQLQRLLDSIAASSTPIRLVVQDNSPSPALSKLFSQHDYRHSGANLGFGAAHNRAITGLQSDVHLILNPDIEFAPDAVAKLIMPLAETPGIVACAPLVRYPDGRLQRLNKLLPTPTNLFVRRFMPFLAKSLDYDYEMQWFSYDCRIDLPNASGCFLAVRTSALHELGGFDERFFMYMEDTDLVRRLRRLGRVVFIPEAVVMHEFGKASYRDQKLMWIHIRSAIRYFNKWGWLLDPEREKLNRLAMRSKPSSAKIGC
ncbi:glycosyltransferase family 2 protein [Chromobacterium sp. ASV23]|uniref:glycosyltransferase family 2 protein n=1 Tax=Chromobacterium sp. ASV23 TaxID=2795110 RepID=UPI0018ECDB74|nr:glycosyltransferase family 2 protein [Chromobacterium sp. ASV23]